MRHRRTVWDIVPVPVWNEQQLRGRSYPDAAKSERDTAQTPAFIVENLPFIEAASPSLLAASGNFFPGVAVSFQTGTGTMSQTVRRCRILDGFTLKAGHKPRQWIGLGTRCWLYGRHGITTSSLVGRPGTPDNQRCSTQLQHLALPSDATHLRSGREWNHQSLGP